jgi:hypothetical protein
MSLRLSNRQRLGAGLLLLVGLAPGYAQPQPAWSSRAGASIEISDPGPNTLMTNLSRLQAEVTGKADRESSPDISSPVTAARESLQGVMPVPPPAASVVYRDRRGRDWLDPDADWSTLSPDDLLRQLALKNILRGPEPNTGSGDASRSDPSRNMPYDQILRDNSSGYPGSANYDLFGAHRGAKSTEKSLSKGDWEDSQLAVNDILGLERSPTFHSPSSKPESVMDLFGLSRAPGSGDLNPNSPNSPNSTQEKEAREAQMNAYQNLLDGIYEVRPPMPEKSSPAPNPWLGASTATAPAANPLNPYAVLPGSTPNPPQSPPPGPPFPGP